MKLSPTAIEPKRQTTGAAAFDLALDLGDPAGKITIRPGDRVTVSSGVSLALPDGHCALVLGRSGLNKWGLVANVGLIDSDYRGEIKMVLRHVGDGYSAPIAFEHGTRVCQLLILALPAVALELVAELDDTERGHGGFGSTGA